MTSESASDVAVELERLRGAVDTGFATLNGRLDVALQRQDQAEKNLEDLEQRVAVLERARWPLPSVAALAGVGALAVTLWEAAAR